MTANASSQMSDRIQLLTQLEAVKAQHPELNQILAQFKINQAEYDRAMLSILDSQSVHYATSATSDEKTYA